MDEKQTELTPPQAAKPMRGWIKILLAVSLALNMMVIGAVGAAMYSFKFRGGDHGPRSANYGPYSRALSREDRKEIGRELRKELKSFNAQKPAKRDAYLALQAALEADVYDKETVHKLIIGHQKFGLKRQEIAQRLFLEHLDSMTPDERRKYSKRLERAVKRGRWKRH